MLSGYKKLRSEAIDLKKILSLLDVKIFYFIIATLLSLSSALFEALSVSALIPLVEGTIKMDFGFVSDLPVLKYIVKNNAYFSSEGAPLFVLLLGIVMGAATLKNILSYISSLVASYQIRQIGNNLRQMIFSRYTGFGKMYFDRTNVGYLYNILISFTTQVMTEMAGSYACLDHLFLLVIYFSIMFCISWKLTLVVIIIMPLLNMVFGELIRKIRKTSESYSLAHTNLSEQINNTLSIIPMIKLYNNESRERENFKRLSTSVQQLEFSIDKKYNLVRPLQEMTIIIAVLFVVSMAAFLVVYDKSVTVASALVFFYILRLSYRSLGAFSTFLSSFARVGGAVSAIKRILSDDDKFFVPEGNLDFKTLASSIEFRHINFKYIQKKPALRDISFTIEKGKVTAIVGPTGSGKTTMVSLLLRLYDCPPDSIFIDGADIRSFTTSSLMKHFSYVSQDILLFNDTIRENLVYGLSEPVSEEAMRQALQKARLSDFIASLPEGMHTQIGDRGIKLSGGEKQRLAIARALLKGGEILILDEATSSLDTKTEKLIQEAINEAVKDRTSIIIAHRLSTIKNVDKIVVIDNGEFVEEGTLDGLLAKKGKFYEYWQEQKFY